MEAFPNARVGNGFGLTETPRSPRFLPHEYARTRPDSVGFAAPVVDLKLFEPDSGGVGELLVRGPNVVKGYWNKPEATAQTVRGWLAAYRRPGAHRRGWLRADRGPQEGHDQPRRRERLLRGSGERLAAHPAVFEVAVMGVPDEMMGEKVGAVIVVRPGREAGCGRYSGLRARALADFKVPQYVVLRQEPLARNPGGKVLKAQLRRSVDWGKPVG
jgi:long-chain acyl-CoA synthetase